MIEYVLVFFAVVICALIYLAQGGLLSRRLASGSPVSARDPTKPMAGETLSPKHITFSDTCAESAYSKKTGRVSPPRAVPMNDLGSV